MYQYQINRKLLLWFFISMVLVFGIFFATLLLITKNRESNNLVRHTYNVVITLKSIGTNIRDAESGVRGFLLTGDSVFLDPYKLGMAQISGNMNRLYLFFRDNPEQRQAFPSFKVLVEQRLDLLKELSIKGREMPDAQLQSYLQLGNKHRGIIRQQLLIMENREWDLLSTRTAIADGTTVKVQQIVWILTFVCKPSKNWLLY
jgi:CHASE3 domain sensor protein